MHDLDPLSPLVNLTTNCERRDVDLVKGVKFEIIFPAGKVDAGKFFTVNQVRFFCACRHVAGAPCSAASSLQQSSTTGLKILVLASTDRLAADCRHPRRRQGLLHPGACG